MQKGGGEGVRGAEKGWGGVRGGHGGRGAERGWGGVKGVGIGVWVQKGDGEGVSQEAGRE